MSFARSWFSKASASRYAPAFDPDDALPRWRSPSPMATSMIPPPVVQSTYATSPRAVAKSSILEGPTPLHDRQSELEADLQFLLDAQAEGLVHGLEGGSRDDQGSTGSTTPTAQSVRSPSAGNSTGPTRRKPGLRSARKGIYNTMLALSSVKDGELRSMDMGAREKEDTLARIDEWEQKRDGLQAATRHVDESEETIRAQRLRQEAGSLQEEINTVALQLSDMRSRHGKLLKQVAAVENSVQAKLATYTSSLSMLETDVQRFLSLQPEAVELTSVTREFGKSRMWQVAPKRRTLAMARKQWSEDRDAVLQQQQSVEQEKAALDEGAAIWKDVVASVTDFERSLKDEMSTMSMSSSHSAWKDPPPLQAEGPQDRLRRLLQRLDTVIQNLEASYETAEQRGWKLLIAAIGAELDALRQGKQILNGLLGIDSERQDLVDAEEHTSGDPIADGGDAIDRLDDSFEPARTAASRRPVSDGEDDPDPELLFSRPDLDRES